MQIIFYLVKNQFHLQYVTTIAIANIELACIHDIVLPYRYFVRLSPSRSFLAPFKSLGDDD